MKCNVNQSSSFIKEALLQKQIDKIVGTEKSFEESIKRLDWARQ